MPDRKTYEEAKSLLAEIQHELATQPLTSHQREELQRHAAALAGQILSPWLPVDWPRRLIIVAIILVAIQQAFVRNYEIFFWWIFLPFFSPRVMGWCAYMLGGIARVFKGA